MTGGEAGSGGIVARPQAPSTVAELVGRQLEAGERALWVGRPEAMRFAAARSRVAFAAGLAFTPLALLWTHGAPQVSLLGQLFHVLFVAYGLALLLSPPWEYWRGLRTLYLVTDRRVVVLDGVVRDSVTSYRPEDIGALDLRPGRGGRGSIVLRREQPATATTPYRDQIGLFALADVREAERHIVALIRGRA